MPGRLRGRIDMAMVHDRAVRLTPLGALLLAAFLGVAWPRAAVAMPSDAQNPANAESVSLGEGAARLYCATCHATGHTGASPNPASPPFPRIAERYRNKRLAGVFFIDGTVVRHPGMPQFEIPIQEADGLIAYLRSLAPPAKPRGKAR
jgi:mono/diheme cytochrome c family protein